MQWLKFAIAIPPAAGEFLKFADFVRVNVLAF
jgi:hypothetical protein